jgi:ABC-2 type transport system ATP-binding protein
MSHAHSFQHKRTHEGTPIIEVKDLVKQYGEFTAVQGLSFSVYPGQVFGLLGPNGAGKTTTLEITETLKRPTSGSVTVDGYDVTQYPDEVKARIGIQLQAAGFYPSLTLVELLELFGIAYGQEVKPMELLAMFNLEEKAKNMFDDLSGGQKQRFSLATTLVNKPKLIFLDEPTTGLDPQARANLWDVIRGIQKTGVTIVLTTHYMDEAEQLCDELLIVDHGKAIASGSPAQLIEDLVATGFSRHEEVKQASLEDVFLHLTGRSLREA